MNYNCCVFRPAFECRTHPKAGQNIFSTVFKPFLLILNLFQWFHGWNKQKSLKKNKKTCFCLLLKARQHAKAGQLLVNPWGGVPRKSLFSVCCEITEKSLKSTKKFEKQLKKNFQPAFRCPQHPKAGQNTQHTTIWKACHFTPRQNVFFFKL